nr:glycoside hydrolase family 31 protein [Bifidobacterium goeldii]
MNPTMQLEPVMNPEAIVSGTNWRIGILSDALLRLEWSDEGVFEDAATQMAVRRNFGQSVHYTVSEADGLLVIETPSLRLTYDRKPFSKEGLSIVVKGVKNTKTNTWHYGEAQSGNLRGTARTLDWANGEIPLGLGVVSRDGWAVLDDSASNLIVSDDANPTVGTRITPREHAETDLYFFGHGHDYAAAVRDFYRLSGDTPLLPRWALGNWWSRFHRYTTDEYLALADRFERERLPFTVAVIDMDWHLVDDVDPKYGSGWTGYTWNRKLIPDPEHFLNGLHQRGYRVTLNDHPRDGIRAFEDCYPKAAAQMDIDPSSEQPVEFDLTNPKFVNTYLDVHHDLEQQGVDFWWVDWQQGGVTRQKGLDPLWALNHLHYLDSGREGHEPLTFSRYAGPGSHRYPVGFSGDTIVTWESLQFQPYFTATASNIGYGWWSHDIGGHMFGYRDEELEARWYQLGVFSPINRLHSTDSPFNGKEPWNFKPEYRESMNESLRLRHRLLPYLHTMNHVAAQEGTPIVRPMYWLEPDNDHAYTVPNEFLFGSQLLVAPITSPMDKASHRASCDVWLPRGEWFDLFDGRRYASSAPDGRRIGVWRGIDRIPVFAKAGAIVPLQELGDGTDSPVNGVDNPQALTVLAFPGAAGSFTLREDDGHGANATTDITMTPVADGDDVTEVVIAPVAGAADAVPATRTWTITLRGVAQGTVSATVDDLPATANAQYDEHTLSLSVTVTASSSAQVRVQFANAPIAANPYVQDAFDALMHADMRYLTKERTYAAIRHDGPLALPSLDAMEHVSSDDMEDCSDSHMPSAVKSVLAEILLRG